MPLFDAIIERTPLWRPEWREALLRMREHPDAPRWNAEVGDRLTAEDLDFVRRYQAGLAEGRRRSEDGPPEAIIEWILMRRGHVPYFQMALAGIDPSRDFARIPTMSRGDLQRRLEDIVPTDVPLERLIVNPTSGTTGHPIPAPNHPRAVGCYDPLIQFCLARHGVRERYDHNVIAAVQLCFQKQTIVYNTVHSFLGGAGFAKVNLDQPQWRDGGSTGRFLTDMAPVFLSGDPIAFGELLRLKIGCKPKAILSCALALTPALRRELQAAFGCPVVDFYSLNETGPIAYSRPDDPTTLQALPNDIYIEIVDTEGNRLPDGQVGEICVTGGRNPYLPLLRYRTGDTGSMAHGHGKTDDPAPLLKLANTRQPVLFRLPSGRRINPIDIGRILRQYPVSRHQCLQRKDLSVELGLDCGDLEYLRDSIARDMAELFGGEVEVTIFYHRDWAGQQSGPYSTE